MKTQDLIEVYGKEYLRVNNRTPEITRKGAWVSVDGNKYQKTELAGMLEIMKKRKSFHSK